MEDDPEDFHDDDADEYCGTCHGMGTVDCYCGGDLCVFLNYGEADCPDCEGL